MKNTWTLAASLAFVCFFSCTDAEITAWEEPPIADPNGAASITIDENQQIETVIIAFKATSPAGLLYELVNDVSPFSVDHKGGTLSITSALDYATAPSYTLLLRASESIDSATATITVVVNTAPVFATVYTPCIVDGSTADTNLVTVSAPDPNGDVVTYGIDDSDFDIDTNSGLIFVRTGATLDKTSTPEYTFNVYAYDATLTGTTTITVTVMDVCSSAVGVAVAVSLMVLLASLMVNIF